MTTVAFDGQTIASDTRQVGDFIDNHHAKKLHTVSGAYIGFAGNIQQALVFIRWFKDQTKPRPNPSHMEEFEALVIRKGKPYYTADLCELVEVGMPCAIGSGGSYAMAAMLAGADAKEAVKIAMKLDPYTGGKVRSIQV